MTHELAPTVILMDLSLPGVDGLEATRQLKAASRTRHIPVLAVTGHASCRDLARALEAGCDGFLVKPTPLQEVVAAIERLVGSPSPRTVETDAS